MLEAVKALQKVGVALVLAISVGVGSATSQSWRTPERRACGHLYSLQDRMKWLPIPRASHCCISGRLVNDLKTVGISQEMYRDDHGRFALTIDELNKEMPSPLRISQPYQFQSNGTNWSIIVSKTASLAGNYLLDASGKIFFNDTHIPTRNDLMLNSAPLQLVR
jgi:hypothetical protein